MLFSRKIIGFFAVFSVLFAACMPQQRLSRQNTNWIYSKSSTELKPEFKVFHYSDDSSRIYFSIKPTKLLYANADGSFKANVKINYKLFNNVDDKLPVDTATFRFNYTQLADTNKFILGNFKVKAGKGKAYVAEIIFTDVNRKQHNTSIIDVDKTQPGNSQNFMLAAYPDSTPLYSNYIGKDQAFTITYNNSATTTLYVKYYFKEAPLPLPPFSDKPPAGPLRPDTVFAITLVNGVSVPQQFSTPGLYVITADTAKPFGLSVLRPDASFPMLTKPMDVLRPLRYLISQKDYDNMAAKPDVKKEVDEFWLRAADNQTRAREVLKNYYTGVRLANTFFTTTREGWRTDRGMIFIIFGQPLSSYKTADAETWIYGNGNGAFAPTFIFDRKPDGVSGYDYFLRRNDNYKPAWYEMVENWRNGRLLYWY